MWHRITLTIEDLGNGEQLKFLDGIRDAILENLRASAEKLRTRGVGNSGPLVEEAMPVEIDSLREGRRCILHLNDAALQLYRALGGRRDVEETVAALPNGRLPSLVRAFIIRIP